MDDRLFINDMREAMGSMLGIFPHDGGVGGCLVHNPQFDYTPGDTGTLAYLSVSGDLNIVLGRFGDAVGEVLLAKTALGEDAGAAVLSAGCGIPKATKSVSTRANSGQSKDSTIGSRFVLPGTSPCRP